MAPDAAFTDLKNTQTRPLTQLSLPIAADWFPNAALGDPGVRSATALGSPRLPVAPCGSLGRLWGDSDRSLALSQPRAASGRPPPVDKGHTGDLAPRTQGTADTRDWGQRTRSSDAILSPARPPPPSLPPRRGHIDSMPWLAARQRWWRWRRRRRRRGPVAARRCRCCQYCECARGNRSSASGRGGVS